MPIQNRNDNMFLHHFDLNLHHTAYELHNVPKTNQLF